MIPTFKKVKLHFRERNITNVFADKNNKTLRQTLRDSGYKCLVPLLMAKYRKKLDYPLGEFLYDLKRRGNSDYKLFLNKYGDNRYCKFAIYDYLDERGIYLFALNKIIKYAGRCTDTFNQRINYGYGMICPKNCYRDGQSTNCRLNSLINAKSKNISLLICSLPKASTRDIILFEKDIIQTYQLDWNLQF